MLTAYHGTKVIKYGKVVMQSKNLAGMRRYASKSPVVSIEMVKDYDGAKGNGLLTVTYADGAVCQAVFNSYKIMQDWIKARRSWRGATISEV